MPLLINKDGKQLGPYSLDEARALVLSGELDAEDWAWPEGAAEWVPLRAVPGFTTVSKPTTPPGTLPVPGTAPLAGEEQLWRGHPSQILNLGVYLFWGIVGLVALVSAYYCDDFTIRAVILIGILAALGQVAWAYIHLHAIEYVVSTQRVRVVAGIFSKDIKEIELFRVKDTAVRQSFFLRLFGLGTITVLSGDKDTPRLVLDGIPQAVDLRERLRHEVMNLRQRFGVREVDVM